MPHIKLKDIPTLLNLFLTILSITLALNHKMELASALLVFNILFLDLLDGLIARLTKTSNEFGKHLDSLIDFLTSSVYVPLLIYIQFKSINHWLAVFLTFYVVLTGVLREVRSKIENISLENYFLGVPRPISALVILGCLNSKMFLEHHWHWPIIAMIVSAASLNLSYWPFIGNDKNKKGFFKQLGLLRSLFLAVVFICQITFSYFGYFWDGLAYFFLALCFYPLCAVEKSTWKILKEKINQKREANS